ncbi:hypothetical protein ACA910_001368 [Epithemia clementina (nom. ined.)]
MAASRCFYSNAHLGTDPGVPLRRADIQIKKALELIPAAKKQAYVKACTTCPDLVFRETQANAFLRFSGNDAWSAAERLVQYWEDRYDLFGERAFLPMTQTGEGALTSDDLVALHAGNYAFLQPSLTTGQEAVFFDRTRALQSSSLKERLRCLFYIFHVLSEREQSQVKGILFFVLLVQPRAINFDHEMVRNSVAIMKRSFPVKVHFHILNILPKSGKRNMVQHIIQSAVCYVMEHFRDDWEVHIQENSGELMSEMRRLGIPASGIPARIGGTWKYEEFSKWCRQRTLHERSLDLPTTASVAAATSTAGGSKAPDSSADKNERKRLVNVIHSREKRERRKAEQKLMEQEAKAMKLRKSRLVEENERLESLLSQATSVVSALESKNDQFANAADPAALHSFGRRSRENTVADQDALPRFQETATALLQRSPEEQNLILILILQKNPQFRQQLEVLVDNQNAVSNRESQAESLISLSQEDNTEQSQDMHLIRDPHPPEDQSFEQLLQLICSRSDQEQENLLQPLLLNNGQDLAQALQRSQELADLFLPKM